MEPEDLVRDMNFYTFPCPNKSCQQPLKDHWRDGKKLHCEKTGCEINETTALGILIAEYQEKFGKRKTEDADLQDMLVRERLAPEPSQPEPEAATREQLEADLTLFDPIIGYDDVKDLIRRALRSPKPVHVFLEGPPASAKTLFLMEIGGLPGSHFVVGGGTTKAGLTEALLTYRPRYLLIDEIETVTNPRDYAALLHLMENFEVVETKYGRHNRVPLLTWVFAAGNDSSRLDPALISRFGGPKSIVHFKKYIPKEFRDVATSVLIKREGLAPEFAAKVASAVLDLQIFDVRAAVRVARLAQDESGLPVVIETIRRWR